MTTAKTLDASEWTTRDLPFVELPHGADQPTNDQRATWAAAAVRSYAFHLVGELGEPVETVICDLLGDLFHLADALGLDMDDMVDRGRRNYAEEVA